MTLRSHPRITLPRGGSAAWIDEGPAGGIFRVELFGVPDAPTTFVSLSATDGLDAGAATASRVAQVFSASVETGVDSCSAVVVAPQTVRVYRLSASVALSAALVATDTGDTAAGTLTRAALASLVGTEAGADSAVGRATSAPIESVRVYRLSAAVGAPVGSQVSLAATDTPDTAAATAARSSVSALVGAESSNDTAAAGATRPALAASTTLETLQDTTTAAATRPAVVAAATSEQPDALSATVGRAAFAQMGAVDSPDTLSATASTPPVRIVSGSAVESGGDSVVSAVVVALLGALAAGESLDAFTAEVFTQAQLTGDLAATESESDSALWVVKLLPGEPVARFAAGPATICFWVEPPSTAYTSGPEPVLDYYTTESSTCPRS